jgi:hypothetical protein
MRKQAEQARRAVHGLGRRGRTTRIPDDVRATVLAYAGQAREAGHSWRQIGEAVGLSGTAVQRWWPGGAVQRRAFVPIAVTATSEHEPAAVVLISPAGYRLEGLDVETAARLLDRLGR